jgi:hypothetical protein
VSERRGRAQKGIPLRPTLMVLSACSRSAAVAADTEMNAIAEVRRSSSVVCAGLVRMSSRRRANVRCIGASLGVLTADQTSPGVACELLCLEAASVGTAARIR